MDVPLVLGVVLVVITTGGAAVVYAPEWVRWSNPSIFHVTRTAEPISVTQAMHIVDAEHPGYGANSVNVYDGLYEVRSASDRFPGFYGVDPGTGTVTGHADPDSGVMAFMEQLHECFFTCQSLPGYVPFLNDAVPTLGMRWLDGVTVSGAILGVAGLLLIFLALSGIWLWWPTLRRLSHGFRVRLDKGRYARDYDLHQAVGIVAVPFLLMWGVTGSSFEFHWVNSAWYAVTGGDQIPQDTFASAAAPTSTPDITPEQALAAAQVAAGPRAHVKYLSLPTAGDGTSTYTIEFSRDFDPWSHGSYPGQYGVEVDRHNAGRIDVDDSGSASTWSNKLLDSWGAPMFHYGQSVNGWWRIPWFLFGLTPLLLAITGVSTWLAKRSVRRARARAAAGAPSPAPTAAAVP